MKTKQIAMTLVELNKPKIGNLLVLLSEKIPLIERKVLMKLLYFIDEAAVSDDGVPITYFDYQICQRGPVPVEMWRDKLNGSNSFSEYVDIRKNDKGASIVTPKVKFQPDEFSEYERRIANSVIDKYGGKTFDELSNLTHKAGTPWALSKEKYDVKDDEDSEHLVELSLAAPESLRPIYDEAHEVMKLHAAMAS